jgi:uncharacterized membrane protein YGL010W
MTALVSKLSDYAAYHRDGRNIAAHMLGIPLIVLALEILLSRPVFMLGGWPLTPAMLASAVAVFYYFMLDVGLALALAVFMGFAAWAGVALGRLPTLEWLAFGIGTFVAGWIVQFIGHAFEGRKPAFFDDLLNLMIGPLFIAAEFGFLLRLRRPLKKAIEGHSGAPR